MTELNEGARRVHEHSFDIDLDRNLKSRPLKISYSILQILDLVLWQLFKV